MKVVHTYSMKGILKMNEGVVVQLKKDDEIVHELMQILKGLDGEEVSITIKHIEHID